MVIVFTSNVWLWQFFFCFLCFKGGFVFHTNGIRPTSYKERNVVFPFQLCPTTLNVCHLPLGLNVHCGKLYNNNWFAKMWQRCLLNGPQSVRISHMHNNEVRNCFCISQRVTGKIVPCSFCGLQVTRTHDIFRIVSQRTGNWKIKDLIICNNCICILYNM